MTGTRIERRENLARGEVKFDGNAAKQWLPAIAAAEEYAKSRGFDGLTYEGTGVLAKGLQREVVVNSIEVQKLMLVDRDGDRHEIGQTLPEAKHIRSLKSTATLTKEFKAMIDEFAGANAPRTVPFGDGNAAAQWLPAVDRAKEYAQSLGFADFGYKGTGILARGLTPPGGARVNGIEEQQIFVVTGGGRRINLGMVLPETRHLAELKSTGTLFAEFKQMIDEAARDQGHATARAHLGAGDAPSNAVDMPSVGRPRRVRAKQD